MAAPAHFLPSAAEVKAVGARTADVVLTLPTADSVGDIVRSVDWSPFQALPRTNYHHCCPVGVGEAAAFTHKPTGLPVYKGKTRFFETAADVRRAVADFGPNFRVGFADDSYRQLKSWSEADILTHARAAWAAVEAGELAGASIEFTPLPGQYKSRSSRATVRNPDGSFRPPMDYLAVTGHGYAHTFSPVHPSAVLVKAPARIDSIRRIHETGTIAGVPLPPAMRAEFARLAASVPAPSVTVKGGYTPEGSDVDEYADQPTDAGGADDAPPDEMTPDEVASVKPTARAAYNLADGLEALLDAAEAEAEAGEHVGGQKKLAVLIERLRKFVPDAAAVGEMVEADTAKKAPAGDAPPEDDADDLDDDEMPALKAVRVEGGRVLRPVGSVHKAWPRTPGDRPAAAEFVPAEPAADLTPDQLKAIERRLARLDRRCERIGWHTH